MHKDQQTHDHPMPLQSCHTPQPRVTQGSLGPSVHVQMAKRHLSFDPSPSDTTSLGRGLRISPKPADPHCAPPRVVPITTPAVSVKGATHGVLHSSRDVLTETRGTLDQSLKKKALAKKLLSLFTDPEIGVVAPSCSMYI